MRGFLLDESVSGFKVAPAEIIYCYRNILSIIC